MLVTVPHNVVMQGHVLDRVSELPSDSVDVVVTSTPYYGLRDYGPDCVSIWGGMAGCEHEWEPYDFSLHNGRGDAQKAAKFSEQSSIPDLKLTNHTCVKCGAWKGQLGLEPHPNLFVEHLAQVFLELKRVLKPSGSLWLNLGDTYFGGKGKSGNGSPERTEIRLAMGETLQHSYDDYSIDKPQNLCKQDGKWLQPKQKMLIPARVAIALQEQGWILRNEIVWHKINHMPESCRDRLTRSWESVFFFVKSDRYFFDLDAIRKLDDGKRVNGANKWKALNSNSPMLQHQGINLNPLGANPGDVWDLTNEGLSEEHFAAFPQKLVKQILECSAPKEICNMCGKPKTRIAQNNGYVEGNGGHVCQKIAEEVGVSESSIFRTHGCNVDRSFLGWKSCSCNVGFHAALVLDPFAGSGTSLLVAHKLGYDWLGIELVQKYCDIINKRIERHGKIRLDGFLPNLEVQVG